MRQSNLCRICFVLFRINQYANNGNSAIVSFTFARTAAITFSSSGEFSTVSIISAMKGIISSTCGDCRGTQTYT